MYPRIAIVSDIHGNLPALEAVVIDIKRRGVDLVVNLGDSLSGPLFPLETAQFLMSTEWLHLAGNHERHLLSKKGRSESASDSYAYSQLGNAELNWLSALRPTSQFSEEVFLCHGTPTSDIESFFESVHKRTMLLASSEEIEQRLAGVAAQVIACGHTHVPRSIRSRAGQLLCNPGSVGLPAYSDPYIVSNGSPDARYAIVEFADGHWRADLLAVTYDFHGVANLAEQRGRHDWASALRTGYAPV